MHRPEPPRSFLLHCARAARRHALLPVLLATVLVGMAAYCFTVLRGSHSFVPKHVVGNVRDAHTGKFSSEYDVDGSSISPDINGLYPVHSDAGGLSLRSARKLMNISFMIIGTWKAGTTSLKRYLADHPHCCLPSAEPLFYNHNYDRGYDWYAQQFEKCTLQQRSTNNTIMIGEKSAGYLYDVRAPLRIANDYPNVRLIIMLRNPVDRLHSHWWMQLHENKTDKSFKKWIDHNRLPLRQSYYAPQLARWLHLFPRDRFLVLTSESFFADTATCFLRVQEFLGLPIISLSNKELRERAATSTDKLGAPRPKIDPKLRRALENMFTERNRELYELLGVDFGW